MTSIITRRRVRVSQENSGGRIKADQVIFLEASLIRSSSTSVYIVSEEDSRCEVFIYYQLPHRSWNGLNVITFTKSTVFQLGERVFLKEPWEFCCRLPCFGSFPSKKVAFKSCFRSQVSLGRWETEHTFYSSTRTVGGLKLLPQKCAITPPQKVEPFVSFPSSDSCLASVWRWKGTDGSCLGKHMPCWLQFSQRPSGLGNLWQICQTVTYLLLQGSFWWLLP